MAVCLIKCTFLLFNTAPEKNIYFVKILYKTNEYL